MAAISLSPLCEVLLLFGTKFQYSCKRRQDEEGKQSDKAAIRDFLSHNTQHPTKETETLDACIVLKEITRHILTTLTFLGNVTL